MESDASFKKVLSVAYSFLSRRPHGTKELGQKLLDKGFEPDTVGEVIEKLLNNRFLDDYDVAYRWAQSRVRDRLWGSAKVYNFLKEKGIPEGIIKRVQLEVWEVFSEYEIACRAVDKRFSSNTQPSQSKILSFLKSRGFSSGIIYKIVKNIENEY